MTRLLFEIRPTDALTFILVSAGLMVVAFLRAIFRRAARRKWIRWWRFDISRGSAEVGFRRKLLVI